MMTDSIQEDKHLDACVFSKTILMFLVVLYHACILWTNTGWGTFNPAFEAPMIGLFAEWLNTFHVYGFVLISGYILGYIIDDRGGYKEFRGFMLRKIKRLIIPCIAFCLVWAIPIDAFFTDNSSVDLFMKFVCGLKLYQYWFLLALFWILLLTRIVYERLSNAKKYMVVAIMVAAIGKVLAHFIPDYFSILSGLFFTPCFWSGIYFWKEGFDELEKIHPFLYFLIDVFLFAVMKVWNNSNNIILRICSKGISFFLPIIGGCLAFLILQRIYKEIGNIQSLHIFGLCREYSMTIFLLHQQIILVCIYFLNGLVSPIMNVILNFTISLVVSIGISILLNRYKFTRMLIGAG